MPMIKSALIFFRSLLAGSLSNYFSFFRTSHTLDRCYLCYNTVVAAIAFVVVVVVIIRADGIAAVIVFICFVAQNTRYCCQPLNSRNIITQKYLVYMYIFRVSE